jgi:hypothetical protein
LGNGALLDGLPETYSNANVSAFLPTYSGNIQANNITILSTSSTVGNVIGGNIVTAGLITATGNITGGNLLAPGAVIATLLTGGNLQVTGGVSGSTVTAVANVTGGNINTGGVVSATGNVRGGNITTAGQMSATGNITTTGFFIGNFSGNISGNLVVPGVNTQVLYNDFGNAGASAGLTFDATANLLTLSGNANVGNLNTVGSVSATGNVIGNYILGNGSQLTGIAASYGNTEVAAFLPTYTGNLAALTAMLPL